MSFEAELRYAKAQNKWFMWVFAMNEAGRALEKAGQVDEAIELYEELLDLDTDTSRPYDRLAIIYRRRKELPNEIRVLEAAIRNVNDPTKRERYRKRMDKATR